VVPECEHEFVHAVQLQVLVALWDIEFLGEQNIFFHFEVGRVPIVRCHFRGLIHLLFFVLIEHRVPKGRIVLVDVGGVMFQQFFLTTSQHVMREVEPDFIEDEPVTVEADEVQRNVLSCRIMGGDQDIVKTLRLGNIVSFDGSVVCSC
jgi:hypothetical protein